MKKISIVVAVILVCATAVAQEKYAAKPSSDASQLEANVRKLWEAFKNKDKVTLSMMNDFTIRPIGQNAALVTYVAQYDGKSGGEVLKGKSVFGEVWIRSGAGWKALYMQETYMK